MTTNTVLLMLLSLIVAGGLSFYQYLYKANNKSKVSLLLASLRFISVFGILLLLINPIISRKTFEVQKTPLPIVIDNSSSIVDLKANQTVLELFKKLNSNSELQEKFEIASYKFDSEFELSSEFDFKGTQSNFEEIAKQEGGIFRKWKRRGNIPIRS